MNERMNDKVYKYLVNFLFCRMSKFYDLIVVGGGIIGAATARQVKQAFPKCSVMLLEKEHEYCKLLFFQLVTSIYSSIQLFTKLDTTVE